MKKLFIGCGIVVLLGMGAIGYVLYTLWPTIMRTAENFQRFSSQMSELDEEHPFSSEDRDRLDPEHFAKALDMRMPLARMIEKYVADVQAPPDEDLDWDEALDPLFLGLEPVLQELPALLREARMGPTEFDWHCRVLWAALESVDAGTGGAELAPLRGRYNALKSAHAEVQREHELPALSELIGEFDPAIVSTAKQVLAADTTRVLEGCTEPGSELLLLQLMRRDGQEFPVPFDTTTNPSDRPGSATDTSSETPEDP